tara:strand:- start:4 stop:468 length:465 start_codon:yes stop_codon:yes gene_type:complete
MKPRFDPSPVINKAIEIEERIIQLEKASECKDCGKKPCNCKDCPECGGKMAKMGCMKMGCGGKMAKGVEALANPKPLEREKINDVNPKLMTESGGQTRTAYYTSNGKTIETEDGNPKRAKDSKKVDLGKLGGRMNPHAGTGVEREDNSGSGSSQ